MKEKTGNALKLFLLTLIMGAFAGVVVWVFLKLVTLCSGYIWDLIPEMTGVSYMPIVFSTAGGFIAGILHKRFGDYPEELDKVMEKIEKDRHYDYHPMSVMLLCAFIPLVCGASVGPEAGLTGLIAGLCYWVGDNVSFAKQNTVVFSEIGEAVTLSQLFHSPLFGIMAVEEKKDETVLQMSKGNKLLLYGISTAAAFIAGLSLSAFFGPAMEGFPSFSEVHMEKTDFLFLLVYIPVGLILFFLFELCEKLTRALSGIMPAILRETVCGAAIGIVGIMLPIAIFSGEEQMGELIGTFVSYSPFFLLGICLLKLFMTTLCINLGMKGGHLFPLIFACACMGFALALFFFPEDPSAHAAFASAAVTGTVLGAQLKKPFTAALLLLLCFPAKSLFIIFFSAVIGKSVAGRFSPTK